MIRSNKNAVTAKRRLGAVTTKEERMRDAIRNKDGQLMNRLLTSGARINDDDPYGNTALMIAADHGCEDMVEDLLEKKAKTNLKDKLGQTALSYACFSGHFKIVQVLLEAKASTNLASTDGQTPLMKACYTRFQHSAAIVQMLVNFKAKIDLQRKDGQTALMMASKANSLDVVEFLCKVKQAETNTQDAEGFSALHHAATSCNFAMVTFLVTYGADPRLKNKKGETVETLATFTNTGGDTVEALQAKAVAAVKQGLQDKAKLALKESEEEAPSRMNLL